MVWIIIGSYVLLAVATAPHRVMLARNGTWGQRGDAPYTTTFMSPIWPLYYLYKGTEWLVKRDKKKHVSLRQKRREKKQALISAGRAAAAEMEEVRAKAFKDMRKQLAEFRTDAMAEWTDKFVALGGDRRTAESRAEQRRRNEREAKARQDEYNREREYERRSYR